MSVNKNVNFCVATISTLLIKIDANRTGQNPPAPNPAAQTSYVATAAAPGPSRQWLSRPSMLVSAFRARIGSKVWKG
jgi:hypothetical protein